MEGSPASRACSAIDGYELERRGALRRRRLASAWVLHHFSNAADWAKTRIRAASVSSGFSSRIQ